MIAGGLAQWQQRLRTASPAELASLDQQVGATHPLRPLITEEVVTRSQAQSGVAPEFEPQQLPMTGAVVNPPAIPDIPIPAAPAPVVPAQPGTIAPAPAFYTPADRQTVRDTSVMMDRIGEATGGVVTDVAAALRGTATDAAATYDQYMPRLVEATGDVLAGWKDAASSAYDQYMPRLVDAGGALRATLTGTGYAEPAPASMLGTQITGGPTPGTSVAPSPGTMPQTTGYPPPAPGTMLHAQIGGHSAPDMQTALIGPAGAPQPPYGSATAASPPPAQLPGGPPPPADPSPLSQVAVPPVKRKPDIPVKAPPRQTTKSANPSAAEALNRFYADQYRQGTIPGAPATVEDARTMASMGDLKGAYR